MTHEEIAAEMNGVDLGDRRLNRRAASLLTTLAVDPTASVNAACDGWAETKAAYRFFDNDLVAPEKIVAPHREATLRRFESNSTVLVVQDTTELDYGDGPATDLGVLNRENRFGLYAHCHVAFTPEGLCLGALGVEFLRREPESLGKAKEREKDPIETKESYRWLSGYRLACDLAAARPDVRIVSVADSECDVYEIFLERERHETPAEYVVRARIDRKTPERDEAAGPLAYQSAEAQVAASPIVAVRNVDLPRTPKREPRTATLTIRACPVVLKPPHDKGRLPQVALNVVLVEEVGGPGDGTDVKWLLWTSLPIGSVEEVLEVVDCYVGRWPIEVYFRTLKTGCRVEKLRLEKESRIRNCAALYLIVAWRVMYTTYLGRVCPDLPCDAVFAECEWKSVWTIAHRNAKKKTPLPKIAPPLSVFVPMLATFGGWNGRKGDPPPGPQTMWIALRRMHDFGLAWLAFHGSD
jgi:hypothetical protein